MNFKTLKEKCEYYRSLPDNRLMPNSYILVMVDGHKFSSLIKNKFKKPFDDNFINMMNEVAKHLCSKIQGAKFALTQSDEISLLITDFDTPDSDSFFGYRYCKLLSLIAAEATAKFNEVYMKYLIHSCNFGESEFENFLDIKIPTCTFDCKVWNVPSYNDVYAWFLYRQIDCIRNSKQQAAQTYLPHKALLKLTADEMIQKLNDEMGIDWNKYPDDRKFGRLIFKIEKEVKGLNKKTGKEEISIRHSWTAVPACDFNEDSTIIKRLIPKMK